MGAQPPVRKNVPDRARGGLVALPSIRGLGLDNVIELEMPLIESVRRPGEQAALMA